MPRHNFCGCWYAPAMESHRFFMEIDHRFLNGSVSIAWNELPEGIVTRNLFVCLTKNLYMKAMFC